MLTNFDFYILNAIQSVRGPVLDRIMIFITYLGSSALIWVVPAAVLLCRRRTRRSGVVILAAMLLGQLFGTLILKNIVMRPRPFNYPQALLTAGNLPISPPMGRWSFPSSHAVTAFAAATAMTLHDKRWGWAAFPAALLVSFSRLYLYVHFPTDVLAGAILGVLCALLAVLICERANKIKD